MVIAVEYDAKHQEETIRRNVDQTVLSVQTSNKVIRCEQLKRTGLDL